MDDLLEYQMPGSSDNVGKWHKMVMRSDKKRNRMNKSIHLQAMQKTHTSIIPEEYEPYSTGKWSINPHAMSIQNQTGSSFAREQIEREYNMY